MQWYERQNRQKALPNAGDPGPIAHGLRNVDDLDRLDRGQLDAMFEDFERHFLPRFETDSGSHSSPFLQKRTKKLLLLSLPYGASCFTDAAAPAEDVFECILKKVGLA